MGRGAQSCSASRAVDCSAAGGAQSCSASRAVACCAATPTAHCAVSRPAALLISIDDMQNDSSLHLATGKWHRLYIGHSALFVSDPITARYYSLARTSNEPTTKHCDELITNRNCCVVSPTSRYWRNLRAESCLTYLTMLFNCIG